MQYWRTKPPMHRVAAHTNLGGGYVELPETFINMSPNSARLRQQQQMYTTVHPTKAMQRTSSARIEMLFVTLRTNYTISSAASHEIYLFTVLAVRLSRTDGNCSRREARNHTCEICDLYCNCQRAQCFEIQFSKPAHRKAPTTTNTFALCVANIRSAAK